MTNKSADNARRVLLVDDDDSLRRLLAMRLESAGFACDTVASGKEAEKAVAMAEPGVVVTDLRMDGMDGLELLTRLRRTNPSLPVIMITAHGSIPDAVEATQHGAVDFLPKPLDHDQLIERIRQALDDAGRLPGTQRGQTYGIVTQNADMLRLLEDTARIAKTEASVLIRGASGTGKELLARAVHQASHRARKPFVAINCGAIPGELLESELFGHKKGAFTGAARDHTGLFASADGGTVFLDEIGDMPLELQVKLLRVLQEREIRPVGASESIPVDVRVVSATHQDLDAAIADGRFREDLLYRLNVVALELPSLNERVEDIPLLADHFLASHSKHSRARVFAPDAMEVLASADWPGNVRQLANVVERCAALAPGRVVDLGLVQRALGKQSEGLVPLAEARDDFVRRYLIKLLKIAQGNVSQAARMAQRNRTEFYKLLSKHDLDPQDFK